MSISTYSELKSTIGDWLNRDDLVSAIPSFIALAEAQIERALRVRQMIGRSTATIDTQYSAVPSDFLETKTFKITSSAPIQPVQFATMEQMDEFDATNSAAQRPTLFTIVGNQIRVHPAPDTSYTAELVYYTKLPKLSDSNPTNWLLASSPDAYLYGSLMQAAPYLKDDERLAVWGNLYNTAIESIKFADQNASASGLIRARVKPFGAR
jgi:hypothetical protein